MKTVFMIVACLLLGACEKTPSAQDTKQRRAARQAKLEVAVNKPLAPRVLQAGMHQLVVIDVPSASDLAYVEKQRCYVWRDAEFKTATMSCPGGETDMDLSNDYDERP